MMVLGINRINLSLNDIYNLLESVFDEVEYVLISIISLTYSLRRGPSGSWVVSQAELGEETKKTPLI